jgi:AP2 domain
MKKIPLTQGQFALVDDHWFDFLNQWKWQARLDKKNGRFYAVRSETLNGKKRVIWMHHEVLPISHGQIDHIDQNGLNNTESNLRHSTYSQNQCNRGKQVNNTSGFKGVTWNKRLKKWVAQIGIDGSKKHIGVYGQLIEAAIAWNKTAIELHGEFAYQNKV